VFVPREHRVGPGLRLAEVASFFGQLQGHALLLVEALGVGPVNPGAGDAIECSYSVEGLDCQGRGLCHRVATRPEGAPLTGRSWRAK
jgi:hypothetical protein